MESIARGAPSTVWRLSSSRYCSGHRRRRSDLKPKNSILENLALCNGFDRTSPELQINGCTAIIDLGEHTPAAAIAFLQ